MHATFTIAAGGRPALIVGRAETGILIVGQVVEYLLLATVCGQRLFRPILLQHTLERFKPAPFCQPLLAVRQRRPLAVPHDLLLGRYCRVQAIAESLIILPVHGRDGGRQSSAVSVVLAVSVEFTETLPLFIKMAL